MRYSSRFFLYAPFAGLLILAAFAMIHWWIVATAIQRRLEAANGHEILPGVILHFSQKRIAGFPFRLDTILKNVRLSVDEVTGPVTWSSEDFAMHALTYGRDQVILEAAGRQTFSWHDGAGRTHRFNFVPGTFRASASLRGGKLDRFDTEIRDLDGEEFRAANVQLHFRANGNAIDAYLKLENAHIADGYAKVLGPDFDTLTGSASLNHIALLDRLLQGQTAPQNALEKWRTDGGQVLVNRLSVKWKDRSRNFSGTLSLDKTHDLSGKLRDSGSALQFTGGRIALSSNLPGP